MEARLLPGVAGGRREDLKFRSAARQRARAERHRQTHVAIGLGLATRQKGRSTGFTTTAALVSEMMEARDERRLLRLQRQIAAFKLLIIDELGSVPLYQYRCGTPVRVDLPPLRTRIGVDLQ